MISDIHITAALCNNRLACFCCLADRFFHRKILCQLLSIRFRITAAKIYPIRILWKLRLLPRGCYFVATKLFWPRWATAHRTVCILIFIACVLFFVLCWTIRYIRQKREEQIMAELIHHYTKDLKPGESRTLEFL